MDTTETYIKMSWKAKKIQTLAESYCDGFSVSCWHAPNHVQCKGHFSDWHMAYKYCPVCGKALKITPEYSICHRMKGDEDIWLPRQDQLQEMVSNYIAQELEHTPTEAHIKLAFLDFANWIKKQYRNEEYVCTPLNVFNSGEQLWLAFVMKEKYNKVWDGEDWVKTII